MPTILQEGRTGSARVFLLAYADKSFDLGLFNQQWLIIEIVTTAILLFTNQTLAKEQVPPKEEEKIEIVIGIVEGKALDASAANTDVEEQVIKHFKDTPILARIAYCESKFEHYDEQGNVLRGRVTPKDIGVMQINEYYHGKTADALGINIHSIEGNLEYAKWLYEREGVTPWNASKKCWKSFNEIAKR